MLVLVGLSLKKPSGTSKTLSNFEIDFLQKKKLLPFGNSVEGLSLLGKMLFYSEEPNFLWLGSGFAFRGWKFFVLILLIVLSFFECSALPHYGPFPNLKTLFLSLRDSLCIM